MSPGRRRELIGLAVLLVGSALLCFTMIGSSGWGNNFYAAAAQAGSQSWRAMLFGASDAPASITVDKPPASLWLMAASARIFGLSPTAVLLPEAVLGVITVGLVYLTVRRVTTAGFAFAAGAATALTPIGVLVFRYSNPDALLTALSALALYGLVRGIEHGRVRWMILVGIAFGFGFLTKQLQAFLPLPGAALAYLIAAPIALGARVRNLLIAGAALLVSAGWWVALVELTPAAARPYIGGSTNNSFLELTVGYNGLGRIFGSGDSSAEGGGEALRLFTGPTGLGFSWLLPATLILAAAALVLQRRRPRTDLSRGLLIGGLTGLVVSGLALSLMGGIYHSYYSAALLPSLAVTLGVSLFEVRLSRGRVSSQSILIAAVAATTVWSAVLLSAGPDQTAWLGPVVVALGAGACALMVVPLFRAIRHLRASRRNRRSETGSHLGDRTQSDAGPHLDSAPLRRFGVGRGAAALAIAAALLGPAAVSIVTASQPHHGAGPIVGSPSHPISAGDPVVVCLLQESGTFEWAGAVSGSTPAAAYQLSSGRPVMPVGGYTHLDPSPTLDQFRAWVAAGRIHWYIGTRGPIADWVAANYQPLQAGTAIVYDLTSPSSMPSGGAQAENTCGVTPRT